MPGDERDLYTWRNDPAAIANSVTGRAVGWEEHRAWFARASSDPMTVLYIAERDGVPVGMCRFDRHEDGVAEVSINIAPEFRRQGLGSSMLESAIDAVRLEPNPPEVLVADIHTDHAASVAIFRRQGFERVGTTAGFDRFRLPLTLV